MATSEVVIQGGTTKLGDMYYRYDWSDTVGHHVLLFTSATVPKIGDKIVDNVLVLADLPISNQDHSKWLPADFDEWPDDAQGSFRKEI